jgi:hypothetical protein
MSHQNENEIRNSSYTGDFSNYHRPPTDINDTYNTHTQKILDQFIKKQKKNSMIKNDYNPNERLAERLKKPTKGGRKKSLRKTNRKRKTRRRRTNRRR